MAIKSKCCDSDVRLVNNPEAMLEKSLGIHRLGNSLVYQCMKCDMVCDVDLAPTQEGKEGDR